MANTKSAAKRARQTTRRTLINKRALTSIKSQLKKTRAEISAKNKETATAEIQKIVSALDKAVKTGRVHRNAANRHKSRLNKQLAALA
ncbi:MAG: small subunit ribosomal protein [Chthoniobacter sp.]|jgi:small subunit ribosomal protein S20|nr:small subunit ribosomal protein [Chthoniobacter sp.]